MSGACSEASASAAKAAANAAAPDQRRADAEVLDQLGIVGLQREEDRGQVGEEDERQKPTANGERREPRLDERLR